MCNLIASSKRGVVAPGSHRLYRWQRWSSDLHIRCPHVFSVESIPSTKYSHWEAERCYRCTFFLIVRNKFLIVDRHNIFLSISRRYFLFNHRYWIRCCPLRRLLFEFGFIQQLPKNLDQQTSTIIRRSIERTSAFGFQGLDTQIP